jgi:hypothetical protein
MRLAQRHGIAGMRGRRPSRGGEWRSGTGILEWGVGVLFLGDAPNMHSYRDSSEPLWLFGQTGGNASLHIHSKDRRKMDAPITRRKRFGAKVAVWTCLPEAGRSVIAEFPLWDLCRLRRRLAKRRSHPLWSHFHWSGWSTNTSSAQTLS